MKQQRFLPVLGLLLPLALAGAENKADMSFSFEKGYAPDAPVKMLKGEKSTTVRPHLGSKVIDKNKLLVPGLKGQGLHIGSRDGKGHDALIFYRKEGLAFAAQGSISFWVRPDDWDSSNKKNVCFVRLIASTNENLSVVSQRFGSKSQLVLGYGMVNKGAADVRYLPKKWEKGQWYHIAVTWGNGKMTLFFNGKAAASRNFKPASGDFNNFSLGAVWGHWSPGSSTLDEVKHFHRELSAKEIKAEFDTRAEKKISARRFLELKLGKKTAKTDGVISPLEYASGFAFMRLSGKNIQPVLSDRQTAAFLSSDDKNLYFAMSTPGSFLKTGIKEKDGNVWEDDSLELYISSNEKAPMYHFIINSSGTVYDAVISRGSEDKKWNCKNLKIKSVNKNGQWILEGSLPWRELGISPKDGNEFYFNVCRNFVGEKAVDKNYAYDRTAASSVGTSLAAGGYADWKTFPKATFDAGTPAFAYSPFESVYKRRIDAQTAVVSSASDMISLSAFINGKPKFHLEQSKNIQPGKVAVFYLKGEVPREGTFVTALKSRKHGTLFSAEIPYFKSAPLLYHSIFTRAEKKQLVFVTECRDSGNVKCSVALKMAEWKSGKEVFKAQQQILSRRGRNMTAFDISKLPEGLFKVNYELRDTRGKVFAKDTEYYAHYKKNPPWHDTPVGTEDVVPVPWTAPVFGKEGFACWGRTYKFGGGGVLGSLASEKKELLSRPVRLILNGQNVSFTAQLQKAGKGYADYLLLPVDKKLPLKIQARAEFDGYIWFDLILNGKGYKINSLRLEVPMDRRYVTAVDDNSSANVKHDISQWKTKSYSINPVFNPFWWVGGALSGIMGGVDNCFDWHFKTKHRGLIYSVTPKEVVVTFNFIDTPLTLDRERKIGFYLQGTPVKPKNGTAAVLRDRVTMWIWSGYITNFYEHKWPGMMYKERYDLMHGIGKRDKSRIFWYCSSKGASPVSPWWNNYGIDWNMAGDPGKAQQDMTVATKTLRDRNLWAWTCLNSKSFKEYKLHTVNWFLNSKEYECRDLYFDLAWPRFCNNPHHGCVKRDAFGYTLRAFDLRELRDFHKRIYIAMKKKDPTALMLGHETFYRVPSDNFFDLIGGGETFERQIAKTHNYYDILTPEVMRILFGLRSNEATVNMSCQIVRTMRMYSPQMYKKLDAQSRNILPKEHRHFYAYSVAHNISNPIFGTRNDVMGPVFSEQYAALGTKRRFHSYWENNGISSVTPHKRFIYGAHSGNGRLFVTVLNDTDKEMTNGVILDSSLVPAAEGKDIFTGQTVRLKNNRMDVKLPPREALFILFKK
ncbi:MAG: hypothetical protein IKC65_03245 [Lentisphaeria bacterium]|nr:hypothetical protein [Lentisphaeria bacterium]